MMPRATAQRSFLPLATAVAVYAVLLALGSRLLGDPDVYWQIRIGEWIIANRALPHADMFSFTMHGQPWISTQWLAQVLYAVAFAWAGWAGPVVLAASAVALAFALLARFIRRYLDDVPAIIILAAAFAVSVSHLLARPHALALPVMVAWTATLLSASERRSAPPLIAAALIALWANLHGSFLFGFVLIAPIGFEAVLNAGPAARRPLVLRWTVFAIAALAASCVTPYGWNSLLAARNILNLGQALPLIGEWAPANFGTFGPLEGVVLALLGLSLVRGVRIPPVRILLLLGLLHMALSHVRNADVFALISPMVLAAPLAPFLNRAGDVAAPPRWYRPAVAGAAALLAALTAGSMFMPYSPAARMAPSAAVAVLKERNAARVFNDYDFGGYLIFAGVPPFIDGRTELYGERLMVDHDRATNLKPVDALFVMLAKYDVDATLLRPATPAVHLLDHLEGWQRIYADDVAVVHIRKPGTDTASAQKITPASR